MHKKAKENWTEEHCSENEGNLRKNNSKRAYELVKDLRKERKEERKQKPTTTEHQLFKTPPKNTNYLRGNDVFERHVKKTNQEMLAAINTGKANR